MLSKKIEVTKGGNFEPVAPGLYTCQIFDVTDVEQFNKFRGEQQTVLNYQFVILTDTKDEGEEGTRGRYLWHRMTPVLSGRSWLLKLVKAVYGRELTDEEMESFDPESIIGKQVDCMVVQNPSSDNTTIYNNIIAYQKTKKKLEGWQPKEGGKADVVKSTSPAVAPVADEDDPEEFISGLEKEEAKAKKANDTTSANANAEAEAAAAEAEAEALELQAKAQAAKARAARLKVGKGE